MNTPRGEQSPPLDFAALYREHASHVHRFALYLSGDPALADDLVSEAFVRAWTARERVELSTVRGYLFAIVRNLFLQEASRQRRRATLDDRLAADDPGPENRADVQDRLRTVLAALTMLPDIDRAAVLMRADDQLPYEDIARALGITVAAARVKVHRARLRLADALGPASAKET